MAFTSYVVDNDKKFQAAIRRAQAVSQDLKIPFSLILKDFYKSEQAIFALQSPGQYPDFKNGGSNSRYAMGKAKAVGFKYPLLMRSGALAASVLSDKAPGSVAIIGPTSLLFGTNIKYGLFHQSDQPRKKIPLRKFLFIGPEAPQFAQGPLSGRAERWLNILNDFVLSKMKSEIKS